jgi:endonuclease-3 related protein
VVQAHIIHELAASGPPPRDSITTSQLYANYHALINEQCVRYCVARRPRCDGPPARRVYSVQQGRNSYLDRLEGCPLRAVCAYYQEHCGTQVLEYNR